MLWEKIFKKDPTPPKEVPSEEAQALKRAKWRIYSQAAVVVLIISVTVILMFAATAAWYTNVVKTSELTFQAAKWGFEGEVTLGNQSITAKPGDSGAIPLTIKNNGSNPVMASVNVTKAYMVEKLHPRVYFYVDAARISGGEVMNRVYLNNTGGYSYLLLGEDELKLTDEEHNDALLKWEWVYDLVGYYYRKDDNGNVAEYLRPIVYDPDQAVYDENGLLASVENGARTTARFLYDITGSDGYPGRISENVTTNNTQEFLVDAANGIWIHLCDQGQIAANDEEDNGIGQEGTEFKARITISAQTELLTPAEVGTVEELAAAFSDSRTDYIKLGSDIELGTTPLTLSGEGNRLVLDMNNRSLHSSADGMFRLENGASLTVLNGSVTGDAEEKGVDEQIMASVQNADLVLSGVTTENVGIAVKVNDSTGSRDSKVRIRDCNLVTTDRTVVPFGNGSYSGQKTQVYIESSTLDSGYVAIMGNGSTMTTPGTLDRWGTEVYVIDCDAAHGHYVRGDYAAVFQPQQQSTITVINSDLSGSTGIALKGGRAILRDSTVTGLGDVELEAPAYSNSGFCNTGDGVYIEANYNWAKALEISGASYIKRASGCKAVRVYQSNAENVSVGLSGGYYSSSIPADYVANGHQLMQNSDEEYPYKIE